MRLIVYDAAKKEIGKKELPVQFSEDIRPDLVKRAVLAIMGNKRQRFVLRMKRLWFMTEIKQGKPLL